MTASGNKLRLLAFRFESDATTAESVRLRLLRRSTQGTGGTAGTEVKADEDDGGITAACVFDVLTTQGTGGDVLAAYRWEQLGPLAEVFTPEMAPVVDPGGVETISLEIAAAIPTDSSVSGYVVWEEI